ncbi:hypothetical protein [Salipiger mucosus]|uniref:Uncharacterized protein n=1 Tax=Salipiger mucosus DSM 16094 TaxID=1123237 RepID=S9RF57_9RHOB|nr:hypothetical protein [Salipiger mucosus]EPX76745.1 hypothetical protein Salmuc_04630 [Salipiger mucosus DSM 16094]
MDEKSYFIIDVERLVPLEDVDPDDLSTDGGRAACEGKFVIQLKDPEGSPEDLSERALDIFHENVGIAVLEHFEITPRSANAAEVEGLGEGDVVEVFEGSGEIAAADRTRIDMIVEVTAAVDFDELPEHEVGSDGAPLKDGSYRITVTDYLEDQLLDQTMELFHGMVELENLEDYTFVARAAAKSETEDSPVAFRRDLGIQSAYGLQSTAGFKP